MNKGNLNKLVTNYPIQLTNEEVENLSLTLSAVRTAGGGGGEGKTYHGEGFVTVNNTYNSISLTTEANEKLNQPIPTKVSDLSDSANYQTVAGMDEYLTTANAQTLYQTKEAMSVYATREWTNDNFISEQELAGSVVPVVEAAGFAYKSYVDGELNKKENKLTFAYDNDKISAINGSALAGQGGVTGDYYSASNPSGFINSTQAETQILEKHYLTEASGNSLYVPIPNGLSDGQYYAMTTSSWKVIQGAGDVSGISTVAHDDTLTGNGNNENLGVDTTKIQTKLTDEEIQNIADVTTLKTASSTWDNVSAKLNTTDFNIYTATTAPSIYQEKGNYLSSNALDGYATTALLDTISSKIESDIPTTVAQLTDSGNYYKKTETSSKNELTIEFTKYQPKGNYLVADDITGKLDKSIYSNASGNWENTYNTVRQYSAAGTWLTAHQPLTDYYKKSETSGKTEITNALNTKVDKPIQQTGKLVYDGDTSAWVSLPAGTTTIVQGQGSVTANYDSSNSTYTVSLLASAENALNKVADKIDTTAVAQTYQTKSDMTNYLTTSDAATTYQPKGDYATTSDISDMATQTWVGQQGFYTKASGDNDYAPKSVTATVNTLTAASAGWNNKVDKPTSLVNQYLVLRTDGDGNVSGWCDFQDQSYSKSEADRTFVATAYIDTTTLSGNGKSVSTKLGVKTDVIATRDYVSGNYLPTSGGTVTGQLEVHGGSNFDSQFIKLTREGNSCGARIGLGSDTTNGTLALKTFNGQGQNTVQVNIKHNTNNNELIQVQKGGSDVGFLIPAVTATTTAGLTNDGILHIILES